jgi:hypothetical protein
MLKALALFALVQVPAPTQELSPSTRYDPSIPTLLQVAGHDVRAEITPPGQVIAYFEALAEAAPDRTQLIRTGETWEGRATVMLVIGSAARMARLDALKTDLRLLADPRTIEVEQAERLVQELPVVTAFVHGVHGNEISSSGAAMAEAYHLLAAQGDATVELILRESLVLIDPMQNPDGRARFVFQNTMGRARWEDATPASAEHDEPWPGGRVNHYLFDLNRDWFAQTQPETRGRVATLLEFMPHVVIDVHEMGGNSTYYFPPNAVPGNAWTTDEQRALTDIFGAANAASFDNRGFAYFNRDTYDAFYPGYGVSWPMAQGAISATYEQASARGLTFLRSDGDQITYGDGVLHHFTAAIQTAATAATHRERILRSFLEFRTSAITLGRSGTSEYVLTSEHDPGMARRLAETLVRSGIEVDKALEPVTVGGRTLPAEGTYIVPMDQPAHRLIRNLLDPHTPMDADFVARQIERRANRLPDQIYDVTAWSLPSLWDVDLIMTDRPTSAATVSLNYTRQMNDVVSLRDATVGYLMPWGTNTAAAVAEALRDGLRIRSAGGEFTLGGREYAVGTAIIRNSDNGPDLPRRLASIATKHGAEVIRIDDSYVREGMSLGSSRVRHLTEPRVLLVYDQPGQTYSVGWARYVLEQRYGQRTTAVRASSLGRVDLSDFDVLVFPSGNYGGVVGDGMRDELRAWMGDGGTMITMAESTRWAANSGLLATTAERRGGREEGDEPPDYQSTDQPIDFLEAIAPNDEAPEQTPGAVVRGLLDTGHWLASGTDGEIGVLVEGTRIFSPITLDRGTNVGRYAEAADLVMGGIVWEDAKPQLASKPFLVHQPIGSGQLIAFAEDPNYRAYAEATQLLFINAVLLGPGR